MQNADSICRPSKCISCDLANRFKDSKDPFRIVIVRDMWLKGFDAPCMHSMYIDKPMQGHVLMQAIAHLNPSFAISRADW